VVNNFPSRVMLWLTDITSEGNYGPHQEPVILEHEASMQWERGTPQTLSVHQLAKKGQFYESIALLSVTVYPGRVIIILDDFSCISI
jgi:hypothetical protein